MLGFESVSRRTTCQTCHDSGLWTVGCLGALLWVWGLGAKASKKVHDTHVEVLKRADGLLGFMAHHDLLEAEHLDRLWDAGRGQPDAQASDLRLAFASKSAGTMGMYCFAATQAVTGGCRLYK